MTQPLVSVVMATYQGDNLEYLREAIRSVLGQTYDPLELIIVADGPLPEETSVYLDALATGDGRVKVLRLETNQGRSRARNTGIEAAGGEYIAILDADDIAHPERIDKQVRFIRESGADVVGSQYRLMDEDGTIFGDGHLPLHPDEIVRWIYLFNPIANPTVLARAQVLKENGYPEHRRYFEDYDLWVRLLRAGYLIENQPDRLLDFRTGPSFMARRTGWWECRNTLSTKLRTVPLYPIFKMPVVIAVSFGLALLRLLPSRLLVWAYGIRSQLRFEQ